MPEQELREVIARTIWESDPGNELPVVGVTWEAHRDQQIANGNGPLLYAQADSVLDALVARVPDGIPAAVETIDRAEWDQAVRELHSGIAIFAGGVDEDEIDEFSLIVDPVMDLYALAMPFFSADTDPALTPEPTDEH